MKALAALSVVLVVAAHSLAACSSWDTGSGTGDDAEQACELTIETLARASERCGDDYKTSYDALLQANAAGDCKNVRTIRDESALRAECIPSLESITCRDLADGKTHPSCAAQLQRTASFTPRLN